MAYVDKLYKELATTILSEGFSYTDPTRGNVAMVQIPSYQLDIPVVGIELPMLTTKRIWFRGVLVELLWMLSGATDIRFLQEHNVRIWDEDAKNFSGSNKVGRIYGAQWRKWHAPQDGWLETTDQIKNLVENLAKTPLNRRHIVTAWNPGELSLMALPPCHWAFEVIPYKENDGSMSFVLKWHQRSVDAFLGLPFDITSYAILGRLIERSTGYTFKRLIGDLSNVHFYKPHLDQLALQLDRETDIRAPKLVLSEGANLLNAKLEDFTLRSYNSGSKLPAKLFTQTTK